MCAGDLPDEGKPEAEALPGFRATGPPVERLEDPLPLVFGHTRPAVENQEPCPRRLAPLHAGLDRSLSPVPARILQKVADETPEQTRVAFRHHGLPADLGPVPGPLLGQEGQQVHRLHPLDGAPGLQPAGLEHLVDDAVDLGDIPRRALLLGLRARHHLEGHPEPRERRPQLVRGVHEHPSLRLDEALDAIGGPVEAARQIGHLVASLDLRARLQVAAPEILDAAAQAFEAASEAPHQRPGADRDRHGEQGEGHQEREGPLPRRVSPARDEDPSVGQIEGQGHVPTPMADPVALVPAGHERRDRLAGGREGASFSVVDADVDLQAGGQALHPGLELLERPIRRGEQLRHGGPESIQEMPLPGLGGVEHPDHGHEDGEDQQDPDDGQVDLERQAAHQSPSCFFANT